MRALNGRFLGRFDGCSCNPPPERSARAQRLLPLVIVDEYSQGHHSKSDLRTIARTEATRTLLSRCPMEPASMMRRPDVDFPTSCAGVPQLLAVDPRPQDPVGLHHPAIHARAVERQREGARAINSDHAA